MICIRRRSGRSSCAAERRRCRRRRSGSMPDVGSHHPHHGLGGRRLAAAGLADERHHLARARPRTRRPSTACTVSFGLPRDRAGEPARDRVARRRGPSTSSSGASVRPLPRSRRGLRHRRVVAGGSAPAWPGARRLEPLAGETVAHGANAESQRGRERAARRARGRAAAARPGSRRPRRRRAGRASPRTACRVYGCRGLVVERRIAPDLDDLARVHDGGAGRRPAPRRAGRA